MESLHCVFCKDEIKLHDIELSLEKHLYHKNPSQLTLLYYLKTDANFC